MSIVGQSDQNSAIGVFDPTAVLERIGGNMQLFAELVEMFLEDYPPLVDQIRQAIAAGNAKTFKYAVHTLRGAIGNFTVTGPYELAKQLESLAQASDLKDTQPLFDSLTNGVDQLASALKRSVSCSNALHNEGE